VKIYSQIKKIIKMKTNRQRFWMTTILASLFLATFIGGCKKDDYVEISGGKCPVVVSTTPLSNATFVPLNLGVITATFNEKMDPSTFDQASFTIDGVLTKSTVPGTVAYNDADSTLSFTLASRLAIASTYTCTVKSTVKDKNGNALQADYKWAFSTGPTVAPIVVSTDPISNATGVPLNKIIRANFSVPMDASTITASTFTLKDGATSIAGAVTFAGSRATFTPTSPLTLNKIYTATITTGAKNLAGVSLESDYVWTFTTLTALSPAVTLTDPLNNATNVPLNATIKATFNMPMDPLTITAPLTFTLMAGTTSISGVVTYTGSVATFTPGADLNTATTYTATITTAAKNPAGIAIAADYVWNFSTGAAVIIPGGIDLGAAADFGILAGVGISNNAGASVIYNMNVGIYPGARSSVTGFPPATVVNGAILCADDLTPPGVNALLNQAKLDLTAAYLAAEGATSPAPTTVSGDQGGKTLAPGIYKSTSTLLIQNGDLTLDAQGNANAVWIFQVASAFTTVGGAGGDVILTGGAQAKNVYWQTGSSAVIGDYTSFNGNVLALQSITMNAYSTAVGRMLARNGSVVMTSTNTITKP
jgi:hypothetical protein